MTPEAVGACMAMGQCISREMAAHWARLAAERGATAEEVAALWTEWEQLQKDSVQTIGGSE